MIYHTWRQNWIARCFYAFVYRHRCRLHRPPDFMAGSGLPPWDMGRSTPVDWIFERRLFFFFFFLMYVCCRCRLLVERDMNHQKSRKEGHKSNDIGRRRAIVSWKLLCSRSEKKLKIDVCWSVWRHKAATWVPSTWLRHDRRFVSAHCIDPVRKRNVYEPLICVARRRGWGGG